MIQIIILAIIQGIAEFLPVSSSGHLEVASVILRRFNFALPSDSLSVSIILHLGTLLSILVYYWRTLLDIVLKLQFKLIFLLILGTIPAVISGLLLKKYCDEVLTNMTLIGVMFLVTAGLLICSQRFAGRKSSQSVGESDSQDLSQISWGQALIVGLFQAVAVLPGLSRSGSTISGGLFSGMKQENAATFSFLLAIPVIAGAGLLDVIKMIKHPESTLPISELMVGFVISFIVGLIALNWVIGWLKQGKLGWFALWLIGMSVVAFVL